MTGRVRVTARPAARRPRPRPRRRRRRRRDRDPAERPLVLLAGLVTVLFGAGLLQVAFTAQRGVPGRAHYDISARFATLDTLGRQGADVRIAGKRVGQALNARLVDGVPTVDLQLDAAVAPLPADSTARIRPRGLLGAEFVDLRPGTSRLTLPDGAVIGPGAGSHAAQLSDVLDALDPARRRALRGLLRGMGGGVAGRGEQLGAMLRRAPALFRRYSRGLAPLLARDRAVSAFVAGSAAFTAALEPVREQIAAGFGRAAGALAPFARERRAVQRTLEVAPAALRDTRGALRRTDTVLARATRFAATASRFTRVAPAALRGTTALLRGARGPLEDARVLVEEARRSVVPVLRLTAAVDPVLPRVRATLDVAREPVGVLGEYGCDLRGFWANWRSFLGYGPPTQRGPLGIQTILRLTVALPGAAVLNQTPGTGGSGMDAEPAPCSLGGPMR